MLLVKFAVQAMSKHMPAAAAVPAVSAEPAMPAPYANKVCRLLLCLLLDACYSCLHLRILPNLLCLLRVQSLLCLNAIPFDLDIFPAL